LVIRRKFIPPDQAQSWLFPFSELRFKKKRFVSGYPFTPAASLVRTGGRGLDKKYWFHVIAFEIYMNNNFDKRSKVPGKEKFIQLGRKEDYGGEDRTLSMGKGQCGK
jgi:hypothetical protein